MPSIAVLEIQFMHIRAWIDGTNLKLIFNPSFPRDSVVAEKGHRVQPHPVQAHPVQASPVQASHVQASPVQASPVQASPVQASPVRPNFLVQLADWPRNTVELMPNAHKLQCRRHHQQDTSNRLSLVR